MIWCGNIRRHGIGEDHPAGDAGSSVGPTLAAYSQGGSVGQSKVGAQLYTIREHVQTSADVAASMKKIADIGYRAVQVSGFGDVDPKDVAAIISLEDLELLERLEDENDLKAAKAAIREAKKKGTKPLSQVIEEMGIER